MPPACSGPPPRASTDAGPSATTVGDLRARARRELADDKSAVATLDSREATLLLAHVLGRSEASLLAHPEHPVPAADAERFLDLLARRLAGEPFAYLAGEREFYGRPFLVDRRVLIPRPETEHLVELVLERAPRSARVADLGTGSGCIALTLALERPDLRVAGTDRSLPALRVAAANRKRLGLDRRVPLLACDLWGALRLASFEVIASNPPYVDPAARASLQVEVREHEPAAALFADDAGLAFYRRLLDPAAPLQGGAWLVLELGAGQLDSVRALAETAFDVEEVVTDYGGVPRVLALRRRGHP